MVLNGGCTIAYPTWTAAQSMSQPKGGTSKGKGGTWQYAHSGCILGIFVIRNMSCHVCRFFIPAPNLNFKPRPKLKLHRDTSTSCHKWLTPSEATKSQALCGGVAIPMLPSNKGYLALRPCYRLSRTGFATYRSSASEAVTCWL